MNYTVHGGYTTDDIARFTEAEFIGSATKKFFSRFLENGTVLVNTCCKNVLEMTRAFFKRQDKGTGPSN